MKKIVYKFKRFSEIYRAQQEKFTAQQNLYKKVCETKIVATPTFIDDWVDIKVDDWVDIRVDYWVDIVDDWVDIEKMIGQILVVDWVVISR